LEVTSGEANGERRSARTLAEGEAACGGALEVTSGEANGERRSARTLAEGEVACGGALKVTIGRSTNGRSSAFPPQQAQKRRLSGTPAAAVFIRLECGWIGRSTNGRS